MATVLESLAVVPRPSPAFSPVASRRSSPKFLHYVGLRPRPIRIPLLMIVARTDSKISSTEIKVRLLMLASSVFMLVSFFPEHLYYICLHNITFCMSFAGRTVLRDIFLDRLIINRDEDALVNSKCPKNLELRWQTEVSSSIYATPLIADINR